MGAVVALAIPALAGLASWSFGRRWPAAVPWGGALAAAGSLLALALGRGTAIDLPWAPAAGLRFALAVDDLAFAYGLLATAVGLLTLIYTAGYLPHHLDEEGRPREDVGRFVAYLLLFLVAMVGLVTAQDLVLLFVFLDLTAVASYLLIGYDRHHEEARSAAWTAVVLTGGTSTLLLLAAALLEHETGTFAIAEAGRRLAPGGTATAAAALIVAAAAAKSAFVPLHLWLPRAMVAATPVSAYLHSAAMVAAGVFLLTRLHPFLDAGGVLPLVAALGAATLAAGSLLALVADRLKELLARSTIAQYGYVAVLLGVGGPEGVAAATYYVVVHAAAKAALFYAAGAVIVAADGEDRISRLGGLARRMPLLAGATGVAAAALAGLPLTGGYFKDEAFLKTLEHESLAAGIAGAVGAALTFAYAARFWFGTFLGPRRSREAEEAERPGAAVTVPVAILAVALLAAGAGPDLPVRLAEDAAWTVAGSGRALHLAYELSVTTALALGAWLGGTAIFLALRNRNRVLAAVDAAAGKVGASRAWDAGVAALTGLADRLHGFEIHDVRIHFRVLLGAAGLLVGGAILASPAVGGKVDPLRLADLPIAAALAVASAAAVAVALLRGHLATALVLSAAGFALAAAYALSGAPDVALVAMLVETVFSLLFLALVSLFPAPRRELDEATPLRKVREAVVGLAAAAFAFLVAWSASERPAVPVASGAYLELAERAHAKDAVTAILTDFRGLDTVGEITVILVASLGAAELLRRRRRR